MRRHSPEIDGAVHRRLFGAAGSAGTGTVPVRCACPRVEGAGGCVLSGRGSGQYSRDDSDWGRAVHEL